MLVPLILGYIGVRCVFRAIAPLFEKEDINTLLGREIEEWGRLQKSDDGGFRLALQRAAEMAAMYKERREWFSQEDDDDDDLYVSSSDEEDEKNQEDDNDRYDLPVWVKTYRHPESDVETIDGKLYYKRSIKPGECFNVTSSQLSMMFGRNQSRF